MNYKMVYKRAVLKSLIFLLVSCQCSNKGIVLVGHQSCLAVIARSVDDVRVNSYIVVVQS
jgi:hypothetical protein